MSGMDVNELRRLLDGLPDGMRYYDLDDLARALRAVRNGDLGKPPAPRLDTLSLNDENGEGQDNGEINSDL